VLLNKEVDRTCLHSTHLMVIPIGPERLESVVYSKGEG